MFNIFHIKNIKNSHSFQSFNNVQYKFDLDTPLFEFLKSKLKEYNIIFYT